MATAAPEAPPSLLNDPAFEASLTEALAKDGKAIAPPAPPAAEPAKDTPPPAPKTEPAPAPKTEPKPGETTVDDDEKVPEDIKSPAAQSSWKKLKEAKKTLERTLADKDKTLAEKEQAIATLRNEFDAYKKTAGTPQPVKVDELPEFKSVKTLLEQREKEAQEYSERLRLLEVERHPKFQEYFNGKTEAQFAIAKNLAGDKAVELLKLPDSPYRTEQLEALLVELSPMKQAQMGAVFTRLSEIDAERQSEIAKARQNFEQIQAEQQQAQERARGEHENAFKHVTGEFADKEKGWAVFQERDGDADWNKGVQERKALAQRVFSGDLKPDERARAAYWSAAAPMVLTQLNAVQRESAATIAKLEARIRELTAANPNPGSGNGDPSNAEQYVPGLEGMMREIEKVVPGAR